MGSRTNSVEQRRAIENEAARLFLDARASGDSAAWDRAHAWIAEHPAHGVAFAKAEVGWELTERLKDVRPRLEPEAIAGPAGRFEAMFSRRAMATVVALSVVGTIGTIGLQKVAAVDRYRTAIGEERAVKLSDGSLAHLNTDSAIEVTIKADRRFVRLLRGEARFDVRPNPASPFVVLANDATLRALGTDFTVRLRPDLTELTVIEGSVAVRDGEAPARTVVDAGTVAAIRGGAVAITAIERAQIARRTTWQTGVLSFAGDPLSQAIEEFNRYRPAPILIGNPQLAALPVTGTWRATGSKAFLRAIERSYGVRATYSRDGSIMLTAGEAR